jgi:hypothetical protein
MFVQPFMDLIIEFGKAVLIFGRNALRGESIGFVL